MKNDDIDRLRREVPILELMARYGVQTQPKGRNHFARCPLHDDKEASLSVDPAKNLWHCFGCDKGGGVYDWVMEIDGLDFKAAASKLLVEFSDGRIKKATQLEKPTEQPEAKIDPVILQSVVNYYHRTLFGPNSQGMNYLKGRGLADAATLEAFQVGYADGTLTKALPKESIQPLKQIGLLNNKDHEHLLGCIVVPAFTAGGRVGEIYGRAIAADRHLYLPGPHRGVIHAKAAEVFDEIILTEAALDALALHAIGHRNVIPCYGTGGFTEDHRELFKRHQVKKVFIAFDNDQAGENAAKKLARDLDISGIEAHRIHLQGDGVKDANDYVRFLRRQGMKPEELTQAFAELLRHAPRVGYSRERASRLTLREHTDESLVFINCDLIYRLRGLFDNSATSLRVILTASLEDAMHTDRFDLYAAKSRVGFAHRVANRLELPAAKVEEDLNALIPMLETLLAEGRGKGEQKKAPPPMSETERGEALRLLRSKDLLRRLGADLETVGYVGEQQPKQLAYLVATSRKLQKPLSAIIRSESGAGKSYLMECVAELMPEEEVQYFSRLTPQSLYYMGENELVHKLLIVDERDGSDEAEYPIRTLQTRRKLTLAVPMKDASSGKIKTIMLVIYGPIAYMESSTKEHINPENLNRCFELYLDASEKQTARIMTRQRRARTLAALDADERRGRVVRQHRNAQRLLRPLKVVVPFADAIRFPTQWLRTRRDHERFLSLLEIIAFLHQYQRPVKKNESGIEYIEATAEDYTATYALAQSVFAQSLHDLTKPGRELYERIKRMVDRDTKQLNIAQRDHWFTRRGIREFTKLPDHQIKRTIRQLEDLEYLDVRRSSQGASHRYRLPSKSAVPALFEGLTTPEELREKWDNRDKSGTRVKNA